MEAACKRLAEALHAACVALEGVRSARPDTTWSDSAGRHVALAVAALPDSVLRAWLLDIQTVGGEEIYRTLKAGADVRANGKDKAA
jgi:hypothetical protein